MCLKMFVFILLFFIQCIQSLPNTTYPISYDLWIDATESWVKENYEGRIEIEIGVVVETNKIVLSYSFVFIALDYEAKLFLIQGDTRVEISTKEIELENMWMQMVIEIDDDDVVLEVGKTYLVIVNFTTYFDGAAKGVYFQGESFYETESHMVATNFLPNYARQAFPCYDEPAYKAPIKLTIVHGNKYNAVSNMPISLQSRDDILGVTTTIFQTTPSLSIHSFGFVISEFKNVTLDKTIKYVAYYDKDHDNNDVELVLNTEDKILTELEKYLAADLGLVEIKEVPQYDDMYTKIGTFGLILTDYQYYYCGSSATLFQREEVIRRTARLMSNQYFSNLITPNAWEDAWITQGISVLLEYSILRTDYANLKSMDTFREKLYKFMSYKRVYYNIDNADMASYLINQSYNWKSAEFMFMIKNIVTEEVFQKVLQNLVAQYRNVPLSTTQFLDMLTNTAHQHKVLPSSYNFATILDTWLTEPGCPVITVMRDYATGKVTITQNDIFQWGDEDATWWIPYNYVIENSDPDWSTTPNGWIENTRSVELNLKDELDSTEWILFNIKQSSYYHTIYDYQNWLLLAAQLDLDHEKIHYINRGHLVSDAFLFGYEKLVPLDVAFASASYLHKEENTFPFRLLFTDEFYSIDTNLFASDIYKNYTIFMRYQMRNIYKRIRTTRSAEELDFDEISLRDTITKFACRMHLKECLEDANEIFGKYYLDAEKIDSKYESDLGYTLLMYGFVLSNETVFWEVFNRINDGDSEKTYYTDMIGMTENPVQTQYLIDILMTPNDETYNGIKINLALNERIDIFRNFIKNNFGALDLFYEILDKQSEQVLEIYGIHYASYLIIDLFGQTNTEQRFEKITAFAPKYETFLEDYAYDAYKARMIVNWNIERSKEFRDLLANYVEKIQEEENLEEEEKDDESKEDDNDDSASSLHISVSFILVMVIIVMHFT